MSADQFLSAKVGDLMTKKVVYIDASMTANEVARLIVEHKIESFPVTERGSLVGIVTGWDLLTKVVARGLNPSKVRVREFMTQSPVTCSPDYSVLQVTKLMTKHGIKRVPVVKNGKVVGIFTSYDVSVYRGIVEHQMVLEPETVPIELPKVVLPGRITTGYKDLDRLLFGGIPENYAVILTSPSYDERDLLIRRFLEAGVKEGQVTLYVTIKVSGVTALAEKFQSNFYVFICNPEADVIIKRLPNVFKLKGVENLTDINITLSSASRKLSKSLEGPRRACIEILSDVLLQHRAVQTRRWLNALIPRLKSNGFTTLTVMDPGMHPPQEARAIVGVFDGEMNIFEKRTRKGLERFLRIEKMYNRRYSKSDLPFQEERL